MTTASFSSINAVAVVNLEMLSDAAQEQVYAAILQMSDDQTRTLRRSIANHPTAAAALKAKDLDASQVVVAIIDGNGALLLITAAVI